MTQTVLILGANGRFGRACADAFAQAGWSVRRFDRARDRLPQAATGADVIVNGWNPPYPDWAAQVPAQIAQVIDAARASGATIIQPANVYVFGPDAPPTLSETTPHRATNPLGRVRIGVEQALRQSGVQTILLRGGDFLDTRASGNWFDAIMAKSLDKGVFTTPGRTDVPHAWAFLPDMARAAVALAQRRAELARFEDIPFPGLTLTGAEMHAVLAQLTGRPVRLKRMAWWPILLARPVWPMARGLAEMRYLWSMPHRLDGGKFARLLPDFRATAPEAALRQAIDPLLAPTPEADGLGATQGRAA